ncbi:hypothetical protein PoB_000733600 [Plakobranchus ocellatus]|uniref:Uncharacterized protein n=1 Tax=Plakobranchus ocellatus TaxID=259542 RepID=A0AAV3YEJ1_9GAST|nr:hypothetical protein PoB_000733600 [Plakobranchus ocellatus]
MIPPQTQQKMEAQVCLVNDKMAQRNTFIAHLNALLKVQSRSSSLNKRSSWFKTPPPSTVFLIGAKFILQGLKSHEKLRIERSAHA